MKAETDIIANIASPILLILCLETFKTDITA